MLRPDYNRIDPKRRNVVDHRRRQFAEAAYKEQNYPYRLNFYPDAPTADITLEQFEQWAMDRLRSMSGLHVLPSSPNHVYLVEKLTMLSSRGA